MRGWLWLPGIVLALAPLACGGGDGAEPASVSTSADAASLTPTAAEVDWMRGICAALSAHTARLGAIPVRSQRPDDLDLDQRRARAEILWRAQAASGEEFLKQIAALRPPARARDIQAAIVAEAESGLRELRRSLAEMDQIFVSVQTIEANNARLELAATGAMAVDRELRRVRALRFLFMSLPDCALSVTPTPAIR